MNFSFSHMCDALSLPASRRTFIKFRFNFGYEILKLITSPSFNSLKSLRRALKGKTFFSSQDVSRVSSLKVNYSIPQIALHPEASIAFISFLSSNSPFRCHNHCDGFSFPRNEHFVMEIRDKRETSITFHAPVFVSKHS